MNAVGTSGSWRAWLLAGALIAVLPPTARADLHEAVNWARSRGCGAAAPRVALRDSALLQQAALSLSRGYSLHAALDASGYRAVQSAAVHLWGAVSDAQVARTLSACHCSTLLDPHFQELGLARRGQDVWMVMAAPLAVPSPQNADAVSRQILTLVNAARAAGHRCGSKYYAPVAPLAFNASLTDAALVHSRDMAKYAEFDHRGHDGSTPTLRVQRAGYGSYRIIGENIAAGAMTPTEVTRGWLASPAHCENIMDPRFSEIGIAFAVNVATAEAVYWTQDFAAPRP
jgi:uncharacterized protein YkwD